MTGKKYLATLKFDITHNGIEFKQSQCFRVDVQTFGFRGGFEGNCHSGQWTIDGNIEPCVIFIIEEIITGVFKPEYIGTVLCLDLCDIILKQEV